MMPRSVWDGIIDKGGFGGPKTPATPYYWADRDQSAASNAPLHPWRPSARRRRPVALRQHAEPNAGVTKPRPGFRRARRCSTGTATITAEPPSNQRSADELIEHYSDQPTSSRSTAKLGMSSSTCIVSSRSTKPRWADTATYFFFFAFAFRVVAACLAPRLRAGVDAVAMPRFLRVAAAFLADLLRSVALRCVLS